MRQILPRGIIWCATLSLAAVPVWGREASARGPVELRVDTLRSPLGIDDPAPKFSWQLHDPARGASQSAYQVQVASSAAGLTENKSDMWDSGRISSPQSLNVRYHGSTLAPGTRYFWRVVVWDAAGKPYKPSEISWWETGLMTQSGWHASWIGYETKEEAAVRAANAAWIASPDAENSGS